MTTGSIGKDRNSIICAACGAANAPGSRFCERCGTRLPQQPGGGQPTRAMPTPVPPVPPDERPIPRPTPLAGSSVPDTTSTREETAQEPPARDEVPDAPAAADGPTVTIDLAPVREAAAPTETFALPQETPAAPPETPPAAPRPAGDPPQGGSRWNYRSWTPPPGGTAPPSTEGEAVPPAEVAQVIRPATDVGATRQEPPSGAPTTAPLGYPFGGTGSGAAPERVGQPYGGGAGYTTGTPGGTAPPPTGYMANAGHYPAPANGSNNRTLWIILGVVGGLVLLCGIICLLIVVVAAASAASTTGVATSVATATRR